jgi:hypothetical protein
VASNLSACGEAPAMRARIMRQPPGRPGACGVNLFHARDVQRVEGLRAHGAIKLRHMADGKRALQRQRGAVVESSELR